MQPACWTQPGKLDDTGSVRDFLQRLELASSVRGHDIGLTAESANWMPSVAAPSLTVLNLMPCPMPSASPTASSP